MFEQTDKAAQIPIYKLAVCSSFFFSFSISVLMSEWQNTISKYVWSKVFNLKMYQFLESWQRSVLRKHIVFSIISTCKCLENKQQQRGKNQTWPKVHVNNAQIVLSCYGERHVFFGVILIFHLKECYLFCHCGVLFNFGNVFILFVFSCLFWVLSISGWDLLSYRSIYVTKI